MTMKNILSSSLILIFLLTACSLPSDAPAQPAADSPVPAAATAVEPPAIQPTETASPTPAPPTETFTPAPPPTAESTSTPTDVPFVESLDATVTADLLSCRYGPGA